MWKEGRLSGIGMGTIFRRKGELFVHEGGSGRSVSAYFLTPFEKDDYCDGDSDCEHFLIDGVIYHRALYWDDDLEREECYDPCLLIRLRSPEIQMKIEIYEE